MAQTDGHNRAMVFPQLTQFTDIALLLLRLMIGIIFITSGWNHVREPEARSKDIGMSKGFTLFLGLAEIAGALGVISGVLAQLAAIGLIVIMLGAIQKKMFVWRTGFWGSSGTNGWSYDAMLIVMSLVIVTTGTGRLSLTEFVEHRPGRPASFVSKTAATAFLEPGCVASIPQAPRAAGEYNPSSSRP